MRIELPLETWTDLFGFLLRSQLLLLVPHISRKRNNKRQGRICEPTIGDRKFVSIVQFYLHRCGQATLDEISIIPPFNRNGTAILILNGHYHELTREFALPADLPMPIPENITDFRKIHLNHADGSVLGILKGFQKNGLLNNVNLIFKCIVDEAHGSQGILAKILHLFTSVNSIVYNGKSLGILQHRKGQPRLPTLTSAGFLRTSCVTDLSDDWYCNWLYTPREDCKPRVLKLYFDHGRAIPFIKHVKKDFRQANQAISFFIHIFILNDKNIQTQTLDNCKTQERLVIQGFQPNEYPMVKILRHPIGAKAEWIEEMGQEWEWQYRQIIIDI